MKKKIDKCPPPEGRKQYSGCLPACSITCGFGGAGAYSDGKFNITIQFGGWLQEYIERDKLFQLIKYVDQIIINYGAPKECTNPVTEEVRKIEKLAAGAGLKLLRAQVRHLGTEVNLQLLKNMYKSLNDRLQLLHRTEVVDIITENEHPNDRVVGVRLKNEDEIFADYVVIAPGRDGSQWLAQLLKKRGLRLTNNQVDIGVRVETSNVIMEDINTHLYEGKFIFNTSLGTTVRTFCSNPSGHVVVENSNGVMTANGHSFRAPELGSENTNFALLVSHRFTEPFDKPITYAKDIAKRANELSNGSVIVQKYGDILKGRRSTKKRIKEGFIEPTLKEAVPGDLGLVLPYNMMKSIIEMIEALDHVTPGIASDHTLFYGVEAKYYSARPMLSKNFETEISGLYVGGDGAGVTRGLAQASANGIHIARGIIKQIDEKKNRKEPAAIFH